MSGRGSSGSALRRRRSSLVLGLDLAGAPTRSTGACMFRGPSRFRTAILGPDADINALVRESQPRLTVVDAPLSLPRGRASLEDRSGPHFRACDRALRAFGIRFFPLTLGPMRQLTERGMRLAREWRCEGFEVVEGYPGGSQDLLGLPRKQQGTEVLQRALRRLGLSGELTRRPLTHDELDAVTIAWVGWLFLRGDAQLVGDPAEGLMLLPRAGERGSAKVHDHLMPRGDSRASQTAPRDAR